MLSEKIPSLPGNDIVVRLARNTDELRLANLLVFRSYVEQGYWRDDLSELDRNPYLHLPTRRAFVAVVGATVLGTASIILDSSFGIPAETFQPEVIGRLRRGGERIAEISGLAIAKDHPHPRHLIDFLMAFVFQYSLYYAGVDRFVAVTTPRHARVHERRYGFERIEGTDHYDYVKVEAQMLTLNLAEGYRAARAQGGGDGRGDLHRFLYLEEHPSLRFPPRADMWRRRPAKEEDAGQPLALAV